MIAGAIYILCALTSLFCALLLLRSYAKKKIRLLLWSGLCFLGLGLNNVVLVIDLLVFTEIDLSTIRTIPALCGMLLLLYGLIWETKE